MNKVEIEALFSLTPKWELGRYSDWSYFIYAIYIFCYEIFPLPELEVGKGLFFDNLFNPFHKLFVTNAFLDIIVYYNFFHPFFRFNRQIRIS